jgi:hypothetical protein
VECKKEMKVQREKGQTQNTGREGALLERATKSLLKVLSTEGWSFVLAGGRLETA